MSTHSSTWLRGIAAVAAGVVLAGMTLSTGANAAPAAHTMPDGMVMEDDPAPPPPPIPNSQSGTIKTGAEYSEPAIIDSRNGVLKVTLTAVATPVRISGKLVNARVYEVKAYGKTYPAAFMPPTLRVYPGDVLQVTLVNHLGEPTNLHTHGFFVSPGGNQDNIFVNIPDGATYTYNYELSKAVAPGAYWYHPHMHGLVEEQVFGGMAGYLYVRGLKKYLPKQDRNLTERFISLKDFQVNKQNTIPAENIDSAAPTNRTVNGLVNPIMSMKPGETQMWHLGNLSADIWYKIALPGWKFTVVGEDSNPVHKPWVADKLIMPPAKRFDLIVTAPQTPGKSSLITEKYSNGPWGDQYPRTELMRINVAGATQKPVKAPAVTTWPFDDLNKADIATTRVFTLSEKPNAGIYMINGVAFHNANDVSATPIAGTVEEWTFKNASLEEHPIHIHVNDMQVTNINGKSIPANGWVDTIAIPVGTKMPNGKIKPGSVTVRMRFREYTGTYVFHCHILAHEDAGMMDVVNVTSAGTVG